MVTTTLPDPPFYFPLRHGRYEVAPGLNRFGKDFGGGHADTQLFQIDRTFSRFRAAKLASRGGDFGKYVRTCDLAPNALADAATFIIRRLVCEHPTHFRAERDDNTTRLHCDLTGETLTFDRDMRLVGGSYADALDALACQVQEDLAIVSTAPGGRHWLSAVHVCLPNGWAPAKKIGRTFDAVHEPVAGMADMNRRGNEFVNIMVRATAGLVRFAWGVTFDDRLNYHPDRPRTPFDPGHPRAFLRVERQTIWGLPQRGASLFTIRTYLYDCDDLRRDSSTREPLVAALRTMPAASLAYKGIAGHVDALLAWLAAPAGTVGSGYNSPP